MHVRDGDTTDKVQMAPSLTRRFASPPFKYCEYVIDQTVPEDWGVTADGTEYGLSTNGGGSSAGAIAGGVIAALVAVALVLVGAMWFRRHRLSEPHMSQSKSMSDLQLEADGGTLREADEGHPGSPQSNGDRNIDVTTTGGDDDDSNGEEESVEASVEAMKSVC